VRPREIVEALPFSQLPVKVYVTGICQQLVEFLLISPVRTLDLAIELRLAGLDVGMATLDRLTVFSMKDQKLHVYGYGSYEPACRAEACSSHCA